MCKSTPQPGPWGAFKVCVCKRVQLVQVTVSAGVPLWVTHARKTARMLCATPGSVLRVLRGDK